MKQNSAQSVTLDDVHSLFAEVTDVGGRRFPQDQRLGILYQHTYTGQLSLASLLGH